MESRLRLHEELCGLLGSRNVYFQPPENIKLKYDCIVYNKADKTLRHANNKKYYMMDRYEVTIIYKDPDNNLTDEILEHFMYSGFERHFTSDNLNHDVLSIYY